MNFATFAQQFDQDFCQWQRTEQCDRRPEFMHDDEPCKALSIEGDGYA